MLHLHHPYRGGLDTASIDMDLAEEGRRLAETFGGGGNPEPTDIVIQQRRGRWFWDVFFGNPDLDCRGSTEALDVALYCVLLASRKSARK